MTDLNERAEGIRGLRKPIGYWKDMGRGEWKCTNCGEIFLVWTTYRDRKRIPTWKYCPMCGEEKGGADGLGKSD